MRLGRGAWHDEVMSIPRVLIIEKLLNELDGLRAFAEELDALPELAERASPFHRASAAAAVLVMEVAERAVTDSEAADEACAETWAALERARGERDALVGEIDRARRSRQMPPRPRRVVRPAPGQPRASAAELYAAILRSSLRG